MRYAGNLVSSTVCIQPVLQPATALQQPLPRPGAGVCPDETRLQLTVEQSERPDMPDYRSRTSTAGRNMAGEDEPYTTLPYFFSDLFDLSFEVWGDLSDWEQTVLRGELDAQSFTFFYFAQDGRLSGVLTMGRPEEEREPMQQLIRVRPPYDDVASQLQDESQDLADLLDT